ncbi:MAG: cytochrome C oxidase subunit II [Acidobacteria bacterium]|nr:MAG: cytochrome C oxidase subunit II [Acidobacteriota bacterium]REK07751.1 MAG: cytochrome C oxidase subunit II [Acidobacteriota bacterium]
MHVDLYERIWMWAASAMIALFLAVVAFSAATQAVHPPGEVETIDPLQVRIQGEFAAPGVHRGPGGETTVVVVAEMFRFEPSVIRVPAGEKVTFRVTSPDVLHGFQVVGTNANVMVAPGYVSEFSLTFPEPGEHLVVCNEYCGLSHHLMSGKLIVEEAR